MAGLIDTKCPVPETACAFAVLAALWCGGLGAGCSPGEREDPGNDQGPQCVVLISLDTLRADRLRLYGYERDTAPRLDALARESVVFATVAAQATQTLVSHKSIFTGKYPLRLLGETTHADLARLSSLNQPADYLVAAFQDLKGELLIGGLRERGYVTAAFTDGGWMRREMGFADGFDVFDDRGGHLAGILPRAYKWLAQHRRRRFFLFIHTYDTHCPYTCREPYNSLFCPDHTRHIPLEGMCGKPELMNQRLTEADRQAISDHYDGGIASADAWVGELLDKLRELKLYDRALIIVTSDHGDSLGEHDQIGHGGLYLEQLLVPLIIKFPAGWQVGPGVITDPVEMVDVLPTVYEACGLEVPEGLDGRSLLPLVREGETQRRFLVAQTTFREGRRSLTNPAKRAVLDPGRWLLIHDARTPSLELFDLQADPRGLTDVAGQAPAELGQLLAVLTAHDQSSSEGRFIRPEPAPMSEELKRQLESLGYVGD